MQMSTGQEGETPGVPVAYSPGIINLLTQPPAEVPITLQVIFLSYCEVIMCSRYEIHIICVWPPLLLKGCEGAPF